MTRNIGSAVRKFVSAAGKPFSTNCGSRREDPRILQLLGANGAVIHDEKSITEKLPFLPKISWCGGSVNRVELFSIVSLGTLSWCNILVFSSSEFSVLHNTFLVPETFATPDQPGYSASTRETIAAEIQAAVAFMRQVGGEESFCEAWLIHPFYTKKMGLPQMPMSLQEMGVDGKILDEEKLLECDPMTNAAKHFTLEAMSQAGLGAIPITQHPVPGLLENGEGNEVFVLTKEKQIEVASSLEEMVKILGNQNLLRPEPITSKANSCRLTQPASLQLVSSN